MTSFELGFLTEASVYGLPQDEAVRMLKRAMEYDETGQLFKSLPTNKESVEEEDADDLDNLSELLRQELIDRHISAAQHKINL